MNKKLLIAGVFALAGLYAGMAQAADETAYKTACAAAEEARKMAAEMKFEWTTIEPLIAKAGDAAAAGDFAKAVKLCDTARFQGEAAVAQAKREADDWRAAVIK
jgi:hypothetical protein